MANNRNRKDRAGTRRSSSRKTATSTVNEQNGIVTGSPNSTKPVYTKASVGPAMWQSNVKAGFSNNIDQFSFVSNPSGPLSSENGTLSFESDYLAKTTPNAMVMWTHHVFGANPSRAHITSAVNQSAFKIKQYIDLQLGMRTQYNAADIAVYIMAVSDIIERIAEAKRAITITNTVSSYPGFLPHGILDLLGIVAEPTPDSTGARIYDVTPGSAAQKIAAMTNIYTDELNMIINEINALPIPAELPILDLNVDLFSSIFADSPNLDNAQLYMFASGGYWIYNETQYAQGAAVKYKKWGDEFGKPGTNYRSIGDMLSAIRHQLALIGRNSESAILTQDLFNAYGTNNLHRIDYLYPDAIVPIEFNEEMLISIENATLVHGLQLGDIVSTVLQGVTGAPIVPYYDDNYDSAINLPLQFHVKPEDVTPRMIELALRFHPVFHSHAKWPVNNNGTEELVDALSPTGMYGFCLIDAIEMSVYTGDASEQMFKKIDCRKRSITDVGTLFTVQDFSRAPMLVNYSVQYGTGSGTDRKAVIKLHAYSGQRDTEVTISHAYLENWFRQQCEIAWNSNLIRPTKGQRAILG